MTTKQEERNILAQIEKLIASAGEDSYIAMAFAGCVEIAHDNINNDFGNSYKEKLALTERSRNELAEARKRAEDECERLKRACARKQEELDQLQAQLKAVKAKQIPTELYIRLHNSISNQLERALVDMERSAETLAHFADCPNDIAVTEGLKHLADAVQRRDNTDKLLTCLEKYEPKNI